jgi:hypothetical protein
MQIISIRFLTFKGFSNKRFALAEMGKTRFNPWKAEGLVFAKHLGVGKGNGFSILPDFSTYAFLGVFESEEYAKQFFTSNARWLEIHSKTERISGWDGFAIKAHGSWNQQQPFILSEVPKYFSGQIAVITRASIRWSQAWRFWMNVPASSKNIELQEGLLMAKGVGELPLVEQATFSLWNSQKQLDQFAYKSRQHAPMIKKTRQYNWYKEEMFVRMAIFKMYDVRGMT